MFIPSGWHYATSSGLDVSASYKVLEFHAGGVRLYIESPNGDKWKLNAYGGGIGIGKSYLLPGSLSISRSNMPSIGSQICKLFDENVDLDTLSDTLIIYAVEGAVAAMGGSGALILFVHSNIITKVTDYGTALFTGGVGIPLAIINESVNAKAYCFVAAYEFDFAIASLSASGKFYKVTTKEKI
jgi:hypothetical protein